MPELHARLMLQRPGFTLDVDLRLPGRGVTAVLGPSGCGKTTLLRCLAGLERASGRVAVGAAVWQDEHRWLPAHRRAVGYVFQEANLFPHLTAAGNLAYAARRAGRDAVHGSAQHLAELLGIAHLLDRLPRQLSGGEQQRVAIARALLSAPQLLLMDEPLASLDAARKADVLPYLQRLQAELKLPVIYVTHAVDEAARLADQLVCMANGRVTAAGDVVQMLAEPEIAAAWGDEAGVVLRAHVASHVAADALSRLVVGSAVLWVPAVPQPVGAAVRTRVLARDVSISTQPPPVSSILNVLPARVDRVVDERAATVLLRLAVAQESGDAVDATLLARITRRSARELGVRPGQRVWAQVKGVALVR